MARPTQGQGCSPHLKTEVIGPPTHMESCPAPGRERLRETGAPGPPSLAPGPAPRPAYLAEGRPPAGSPRRGVSEEATEESCSPDRPE